MTHPARSRVRRSSELHRALVGILHLEDRIQPGSLFANGLDMSALEGLIARPAPTEHELVRVFSAKRAPSEVSTFVTDVPVEYGTSREEVKVSRPSDPVEELLPPNTPAPVGIANTSSARPHVAHAPTAQPLYPPSSRVGAPPSAPTSQATPASNASHLKAIKSSPTRDVLAPGQVTHSQTRTAPFDPANYVKSDCENTAGKANLYNTYDGTANDDQNFAVAGGIGANIGQNYAVGYKGPDGSVSHFGPAGNCLGAFLVNPGTGAWVKDVAVGVNGVYITGHQPGGTSSFIIRLTPALGFVNGVTFFAPLGGTVYLNSIAVGTPVAPNVFATGSWFDPSSTTPFDITKVIMRNFNLLPNYDVDLFFAPGPSVGLSIATDRGFIAYVGGRASIAGSPADMPHTFSLFPTPSIAWSFITTSTTAISDPQNGIHGITFQGSNIGLGIYAAGSMADSALNGGGEQNLVLEKRQVSSGAIIYAFLYGIPSFENAGKANAVNRLGDHFVAGYRGPFASHDAMLLRYNPAGTLVDQAFLGGPGTEDRAFGITLRTPQPGDDVSIAGMTDTPNGSMTPIPTLCDPTWNGLVDGFVAKWSQPF